MTSEKACPHKVEFSPCLNLRKLSWMLARLEALKRIQTKKRPREKQRRSTINLHCCTVAHVSSAKPHYPFTPKSDQFRISPAASPETLHHTLWRTWLFVAYSDEAWLYNQFLTTSLIHLPWKRLGKCNFWAWEWKGKKKKNPALLRDTLDFHLQEVDSRIVLHSVSSVSPTENPDGEKSGSVRFPGLSFLSVLFIIHFLTNLKRWLPWKSLFAGKQTETCHVFLVSSLGIKYKLSEVTPFLVTTLSWRWILFLMNGDEILLINWLFRPVIHYLVSRNGILFWEQHFPLADPG